MEHNQEKRRAAAHEFFRSLDQLEDILQVDENQDEAMPKLESGSAIEDQVSTSDLAIDLEALEEAVADIEQYFDKGSSGSCH